MSRAESRGAASAAAIGVRKGLFLLLQIDAVPPSSHARNPHFRRKRLSAAHRTGSPRFAVAPMVLCGAERDQIASKHRGDRREQRAFAEMCEAGEPFRFAQLCRRSFAPDSPRFSFSLHCLLKQTHVERADRTISKSWRRFQLPLRSLHRNYWNDPVSHRTASESAARVRPLCPSQSNRECSLPIRHQAFVLHTRLPAFQSIAKPRYTQRCRDGRFQNNRVSRHKTRKKVVRFHPSLPLELIRHNEVFAASRESSKHHKQRRKRHDNTACIRFPAFPHGSTLTFQVWDHDKEPPLSSLHFC